MRAKGTLVSEMGEVNRLLWLFIGRPPDQFLSGAGNLRRLVQAPNCLPTSLRLYSASSEYGGNSRLSESPSGSTKGQMSAFGWNTVIEYKYRLCVVLL
jgi:hypothetical protein